MNSSSSSMLYFPNQSYMYGSLHILSTQRWPLFFIKCQTYLYLHAHIINDSMWTLNDYFKLLESSRWCILISITDVSILDKTIFSILVRAYQCKPFWYILKTSVKSHFNIHFHVVFNVGFIPLTNWLPCVINYISLLTRGMRWWQFFLIYLKLLTECGTKVFYTKLKGLKLVANCLNI